MFCTTCGNTVKENRFCTRCGSSLPPSKGIASGATTRKKDALHEAATLSCLPPNSLAAPSAGSTFAPTTRRLANSTTAQQANAPTTVPVTTAIAALPRKPALRGIVWIFPLLFVVSGFWWGRQSAVMAQLQGFVTTPSTSVPTPAPLASTTIEVPEVAPTEALPAPANELPDVTEVTEMKEAEPQPQAVLKSFSPAQSSAKPQAQPRLRFTPKPEIRIQRAQAKPQAPRPLAEQLKAQKKPEAILVLEVKGDFGKKGKKLKEMCDKE